MINSPPSARTDSSLYMHFPAVHNSSYISGAQARMVWNGLSIVRVWRSEERSAAADHASSTGPANRPLMPSLSTTMQKASLGIFTIAPARSTTLRTGVHLWPMILGVVITAASQWKKCSTSGPDTPGKRYLLPPEKPTTSCGKTGPMMTM